MCLSVYEIRTGNRERPSGGQCKCLLCSEMSPKNQVLPLHFITLKYVSTLLVHRLSDDEGLNYDSVLRYLSETTHEVLQDLLKVILSTENLDAYTRFSCLQIMLREDIRRLDTGLFPHSYYESILQVIREKGAGLHHLNLKGVWLRDYPAALSECLERLKNLKSLIIPHMPDDSVLKSVMMCEQLSILDISGECNFSAGGLSNFKSNSLKVLSIGMYGKRIICEDNSQPVEVVAKLIENLPNLQVIKSYSFTGEALLKLYQTNEHFRTKLKYVHDSHTTTETLKAIATLCPELQSVNFNTPQKNTTANLYDLKRLNSLKLSDANLEEFSIYLQLSGGKLQTLKLGSIKTGSLDLSKICMFSPELNTLECYKSKLICLQPDTYFMNLQNIEILYCDISDFILRYLLQNSPFLRRIVVGDMIRMTDGDIFRICADCELQSLEELWFSGARGLTVISVELLMGHCPLLRVLGQLNGWDVSAGDVEYLRAIIFSANMDLTLLPLEMDSHS